MSVNHAEIAEVVAAMNRGDSIVVDQTGGCHPATPYWRARTQRHLKTTSGITYRSEADATLVRGRKEPKPSATPISQRRKTSGGRT